MTAEARGRRGCPGHRPTADRHGAAAECRRTERAGAGAARSRILRMVLEAATEPFVVLLLIARDRCAIAPRRGPRRPAGAARPRADRRRRRRHRVPRRARARGAARGLRAAGARPARRRRSWTSRRRSSSRATSSLLRAGDVVPADLRLTARRRPASRPKRPDRRVAAGAGQRSNPIRPAPRSPTAGPIAYAGTSVVGGRGEGIVVAIGLGDRARPDRARPGHDAAASLAAPARARSARPDPARRRRRAHRDHDRAGVRCAATRSARTSWRGSRPRSPRSRRSRRSSSRSSSGSGAYRLLRRGVLVRRLNAEETLGAVDLIVTDKTGTLTENRLAVVSVLDADGPGRCEPAHGAILLDALRAEDDAWHGDGTRAPGSFTRALAGRARRTAGGDAAARRPRTSLEPPGRSTRPAVSLDLVARAGTAVGDPRDRGAGGDPRRSSRRAPTRTPGTRPSRPRRGRGERLVALAQREATTGASRR